MNTYYTNSFNNITYTTEDNKTPRALLTDYVLRGSNPRPLADLTQVIFDDIYTHLKQNRTVTIKACVAASIDSFIIRLTLYQQQYQITYDGTEITSRHTCTMNCHAPCPIIHDYTVRLQDYTKDTIKQIWP